MTTSRVQQTHAAGDEDFWAHIQQSFDIDRTWINLNNGGVSPAPRVVLDAMRRHLEFINNLPARILFEVLLPQVETVRIGLARMFGCDAEEIAITRNTSESMEICLLGIDLRRGEEVLCSGHDYPRMITTLRQREMRDGIVLKMFPFPAPAKSQSEIVELYERNITPKTKVVLIPHIIHHTGQVMPVREVVALGRSRGIEVVVDGGHSFAHLDFHHADLDCDYYGTSLHKWLFAPVGTGLLYMRKSKIASVWPLLAAVMPRSDDIRKFEEIGSHPTGAYLAIAEAMQFTESIGMARKAARLRFLRDRWARPLQRLDRVHFYANLDMEPSCGIATFGIDGIQAGELARYLANKHCIYVTPIEHPERKDTPGDPINGIRITPNVYTTLSELDRFVGAIEEVIHNGIKIA
ncbi:MAG: aminotransferase class V-fold PLP-dependent enzyme [Planctomycetes bacterium]|nr:aminotransferase class V-fold PLP-dependent enzyme [Planctomycetota bacterium]